MSYVLGAITKKEAAVDNLIKGIKDNYVSWYKTVNTSQKFRREAISRFNNGIRVEVGSKYTKIFTGSSIWGFIVNENNSVKCTNSGCYFSRGDLLKPASYKAPARNFARGNIRDGENVKSDPASWSSSRKDCSSAPEYPNYRLAWTSAV